MIFFLHRRSARPYFSKPTEVRCDKPDIIKLMPVPLPFDILRATCRTCGSPKPTLFTGWKTFRCSAPASWTCAARRKRRQAAGQPGSL